MRRLVVFFVSAAILAACSDSDQGNVGDVGLGDTTTGDLGDVAVPDATPDATPDDSDATPDVPDTSVTPDTTPDTTPNETTDTQGEVIDQQICLPGLYVCNSISMRAQCAPDGKSYLPPEPCGSDESCRNGVCTPRCPNDPKFGVYVGCEFWATDLPNYPDPTLNPTPENLPWALVISNPGTTDVRVGFEMPPLFNYAPPDDTVPGGQSRTFQLPNINVQGTSLMPKGVYVVATGPVLVHQFNPWDNRFSNDASMLLPEPLLGRDHVILSWTTSPFDIVAIPGFPTPPNQNGYFTIIAAYANTNVTFTVTAPVRASGAIPKLNPGSTHTVRLNRGDVLSIQADPESLFAPADISGSVVRADKPIAVFGGHEQAVIGDEVEVMGENGPQMQSPCCADHLEEQMFPLELLSTRYYAPKSPPRGTSSVEDDFWRIQAAEDNVQVTTNPAQVGANGITLAKRGDFVTVKTNQSFEVVGTGKLQVGQYLTARDTTQDFTGDSSLVLMVASDRYRKDYAFSVPSGYNSLKATIVRQTGTAVTIDGQAVSGSFAPIANTGWELGYVTVAPGYHVASSAGRFGLFVYGYSNAVSFSYIGGLAGPGE
jgi:hypothetical protein